MDQANDTSVSKSWNWNEVTDQYWLNPSEESFYLADRWKKSGFYTLLDFGCGLGRNAVFFASNGFDVSAFDLSPDAVSHLKTWAERDRLNIDVKEADMLKLPYPDHSFDCLLAYHVISHTDTKGMQAILREIKRVMKPGGEFYLTLCSKETWSSFEAGFPKIDENTVIKTDDGPEKDVPHFYVNLDEIIPLFKDF